MYAQKKSHDDHLDYHPHHHHPDHHHPDHHHTDRHSPPYQYPPPPDNQYHPHHPHQCPDLNLQPGVRDGANHGVHQHPKPAVRRGGGGALRGQVHSCLVVQGMLKYSTTI